MPDVIIIAGPNGAGKSTLAPSLLKDIFGSIEFVNADNIAADLAPTGKAEIEAGKQMLRRLKELSDRRESFSFETTLSGRGYAKFLKRLQSIGYTVQIAFLWLPDIELSIQRVAERVRNGGHDIPEGAIKRRFSRGKRNFLKTYLPLADVWRVYDASAEEPKLVGFSDKIDGETIVDKALWERITE